MDKEIVDKQIGAETHFDLDLVGGKLVVKITYGGTDGAKVALSAEVPPKVYLEKLKAVIPGTIDDLIIDLASNAAGLK